MADDKNVLDANAGAPGADIPDLKDLKKKEEKERKKAGAAWSGAAQGAGKIPGSAGGIARAAASVMEESAAFGGAQTLAGAQALEGGGLGAWLSRAFAGLTGTLLGRLAVGAAAFLLAAGAAVFGYSLLKGSGDQSGAPNLGGLTDSLRLRGGGGDRLGFRNDGNLRWDALKQNPDAEQAQPAPQEKKPQDKAPDEAAAPDAKKGAWTPQDRLAHNLGGSKLSSSLGGNFGRSNVFSGGGLSGVAPKFNGGLSNVGGARAAPRAATGKLAAARSTPRALAGRRGIGVANSGKAIAQAKFAKGMSVAGAQAGGPETAASAANGAFDQQRIGGGGLNSIAGPGVGGGVPADLSGGDGLPTNPDFTTPTAPDAPTGTSYDPGLQSSLRQIGAMADQARQMMQTGQMLMMLGLALIAAGAAVMPIFPPITTAIGAMLIGLGGMMLGMGFMMQNMGKMMAQMAKAMGAALSAQIDNRQQGRVINYCTDQALAGTPTADCAPPDSITNAQRQDARNQSDLQKAKQVTAGDPTVQPRTQP